jgi:hypothetical protein
MTQISFTSGELMDIISLLDRKSVSVYLEDPQLSAYYGNIQQQFEHLLDKVKEMQPENRVAHLVLAA